MSNHVPSLEEVREHLYSAVISDALDAAGFRTQWVQQQRLTNTAFSNFVVM